MNKILKLSMVLFLICAVLCIGVYFSLNSGDEGMRGKRKKKKKGGASI